MRASEKTKEINAYVTGLGASKRVVVWDTTLRRLNEDETLLVLGHEIGHYALGHVMKGFIYFELGTLLAFGLGFVIVRWLIKRFGAELQRPYFIPVGIVLTDEGVIVAGGCLSGKNSLSGSRQVDSIPVRPRSVRNIGC